MKRIIFVLFFISLYLSILVSPVSAALLTVTPKGQIVWQVLGDSTIEVKKVAGNVAVVNGKIELNNPNVANTPVDLVELAARPNSNDLKIAEVNGQFNIEENGFTANTTFPITIDPAKNELSVTTNSGVRTVSVLPYEATLSLTRAKIITSINSNKMDLKEDDKGELQYSIAGIKKINLLNIAEISGNVNSTVSATTGEILKINEPQWLRFLGVIL